MDLLFNWGVVIKFVVFNFVIVCEFVDVLDWLCWNKGDFFGMFYNGYGVVDK